MSEQALTEAYEKQMQTVQTLRKDNNKLKEQLLQHENFARMIQYGLNALPSDCRDVDRKKIAGVPMWISDQMNPLKGPTLVVDLNLCHEAVRHAYNELKTFGPSVNSKTNVCYAMGWKTELWAANTCLNFRAMRSISDKNIREVANASWDIITSPEKCKRIYPDVKQFRILQKVTDDIVVVHRIASVASDMSDREFISVAFRLRDGDDYYIGLKSITVQTEAAENCVRGEECQGWMFIGGENETSQWKAHFLGYYDVKGEKDDKVLNQLANEAMFGMLRWESEAMHPLSVVDDFRASVDEVKAPSVVQGAVTDRRMHTGVAVSVSLDSSRLEVDSKTRKSKQNLPARTGLSKSWQMATLLTAVKKTFRPINPQSILFPPHSKSGRMSTHSGASGGSAARKQTPCSFFAAGKCRNGSSCKFFHAPREELAVIPLPCKFFLQGACKAGRDCKFSHSAQAQAAATRVSASTGEKTVVPGSYGVPCKFFKYGDCSNGDKCPYLHVQKKEKKDSEHKGKAEAEAKTEGTSTPEKKHDDEEEEKPATPVAETSGEEQDAQKDAEDVTELRDFISKEEGALCNEDVSLHVVLLAYGIGG
ncbi:unnamed protein product [Phytophthora fragariaefolia]|uniref:Unnamed protein product n=1 Tax=Phytophthora fragariaefolia TaxID=1490495 RepID=A0A9W7D098_9STRA|nr:unnamed protein product [Phytophthora fragariaefolia]